MAVMPERVQALVVGAGVVGVAVARALARAGREVVLIERERGMGQHGSSRNSEVVHAGLYYPPGSLKARLCVEGRHALARYCASRGVGYRPIGKLVVATDEAQRATLAALRARAHDNGVDDLRPLDAHDITAIEPRVVAVAGLWSPSTAIVDSEGLLRALWSEAHDLGASLALATPLESDVPREDGNDVHAGSTTVRCQLLVNAAGLGATAVAQSIAGLSPDHIPTSHLLKGSYFSVAGRPALSHLVYPVPDTHSLGIHVTLDIGGGVRLGPDQQWVDHIDYTVDPGRARHFAQAAARYWPQVDVSMLQPAYAGIRAKIVGPGQPAADFRIDGPRDHGIPGLCNLFGIESPGLTSSIAIADEVLRRLGIDPAGAGSAR